MSRSCEFEYKLPAVSIPAGDEDTDTEIGYNISSPKVSNIGMRTSFELKHMMGHFNPNKPVKNDFMIKLMERYAEYYEPKEMKTGFVEEADDMTEAEYARK